MGVLNRRELLASFAAAAATSRPSDTTFRPSIDEHARTDTARQIRMDAARCQSSQISSINAGNGDDLLPRNSGVFTKGLPLYQVGEVDGAAHQTLLQAIATGSHEDFERISRGSGRRFVSPQAAYAFQLEGGDSHRFACPPPPAFSSAEA